MRLLRESASLLRAVGPTEVFTKAEEELGQTCGSEELG